MVIKNNMEILNNTYLKFIDFNELSLWDVKRLFLSSVKSKYKIVSLKEVIKERSEKVNLYDFHDENFGILGVNNKEGIFDAYEEIGKNINQSYKKVYLCDLAYNPYRVNVGSVGIKTEKHKFDYISPAYVVFSCDKTQLLPEYFYILFKSNLFNGLVNENTTGSVRQNLKFSTLKKIKIPLPSLEEQNRIVEEYNKKLQDSFNAEIKAGELEKEIESYLMEELGIEFSKKNEKKVGLSFIDFKSLSRWDLSKNLSSGKSIKYENILFKDIIVGDPMYGANVSGVDKISEIRYIRITDINESGELNNDFVSPESIDEKFILNENDFLIARSGNTVGKTFLYKEKYGKSMFAGYLVKYILDENIVIPEYILYYTKGLNFKKWIEANQRISGQPNINGQEYLYSPFILPPLEIQEKIVKHIGDLKDEIKSLKKLAIDLKESAKVEFEKEIFS